MLLHYTIVYSVMLLQTPAKLTALQTIMSVLQITAQLTLVKLQLLLN